jgi:hypothetical protein
MTLLIKEFAFYGLEARKEQIAMWAEELSDLTEADVSRALSSLRKDPNRTKPPFPATIRSEVSGWPGPEQAWAESPKSEDESSVITNEACAALAAVSQFLRDGNMIQARIVFVEVYKNEVAKSLAEKKKAKWFPSFGAYSSQTEKDRCMMEAVSKNRMSSTIALTYRCDLKLESKSDRLMIESKENGETSDEQREKNLQRTQGLIAMLNKKNEINKKDRPEG